MGVVRAVSLYTMARSIPQLWRAYGISCTPETQIRVNDKTLGYTHACFLPGLAFSIIPLPLMHGHPITVRLLPTERGSTMQSISSRSRPKRIHKAHSKTKRTVDCRLCPWYGPTTGRFKPSPSMNWLSRYDFT